ncbi:MAG: hypothetical protein AAFW00_25605 [Bacteroidota bacterium]
MMKLIVSHQEPSRGNTRIVHQWKYAGLPYFLKKKSDIEITDEI